MNERDLDALIARLNAAVESALRDYFEGSICGICGSPVVFDNWMDIHVCRQCGAIETEKGWQAR